MYFKWSTELTLIESNKFFFGSYVLLDYRSTYTKCIPWQSFAGSQRREEKATFDRGKKG
jgi:hypothetical protein